MSIRVLVVDDAAIFRRIVSEALAGIPDVEVVGTASNGKLALARLPSLRPDLLTLDIEMPEMNGIQTLEALASSDYTGSNKPGAIVLSSLTRRGGELTMRALELGAFDFVTKPESASPADGILQLRNYLTPILREYHAQKEKRRRPGRALPTPQTANAQKTAVIEPVRPAAVRSAGRGAASMVLIGVSTGGPKALTELLPALPANLNAPVFIVQHMPPMFTQALAVSLQPKCSLRVKEAEDNEVARPGCVYLAPGGRHMKIVAGAQGEIVVKLSDEAPENNCRPAVDVLFASAALHFPGRSVAAILTGMGQDGTKGLKMLKRGGCFCVAQDEASCVVFGMPKAAIEAGVADVILPLPAIAPALVRQLGEAGLGGGHLL